jgi:hypothetical protein
MNWNLMNQDRSPIVAALGGTVKSVKYLLVILGILMTTPAMAEKKSSKRNSPIVPKKTESTKIDSPTASDDGYVAASSTHIDFSETSIDGKMKAPDGFMLQGHQGSQLSQMVKLRSHFRNELNNSKSATKALVK